MRKTSTLTLLVVCLAQIVHAQISKGSLFLGGSIGYSHNSNEMEYNPSGNTVQDNKNTTWSFQPQIGKAVAANQIVGVFLNFSKTSGSQQSGLNRLLNETTGNGGGIFYRRYHGLSNRLYLFGDAALGANFTRQQTNNDNGTINYASFKNKNTAINLSITPGLSFAASRKVYLEASLNSLLAIGYSWGNSHTYDVRGTVQQTQNQKSFSAGANANATSGLSVGLRWILPSKS